jgi:hypothetical protein
VPVLQFIAISTTLVQEEMKGRDIREAESPGDWSEPDIYLMSSKASEWLEMKELKEKISEKTVPSGMKSTFATFMKK